MVKNNFGQKNREKINLKYAYRLYGPYRKSSKPIALFASCGAVLETDETKTSKELNNRQIALNF
jgi:hypothetical protein